MSVNFGFSILGNKKGNTKETLMVYLEMMGMIGNNLFQYAFARILAEEMGYALKIKHSTYESKTNTPLFEKLMASFKDAPLELPGKTYENPIDYTAAMGHSQFDGYHITPEDMVRNNQNRKIYVRGYFERYDCLRNHKNKLREWFHIQSTSLGHSIQDNDIVLHIRRGDFISYGRAISLSYYVKLLRRLNYRKLYICGIGFDEDVKKCFKPYNPIYVQSNPFDDFCFIKGFRRIILSQSTFGWWSAFLSEAEKIYAPIPIPRSTEFLRDCPHADLRVDDETRFEYVNNVPPIEKLYNITDVLKSAQYLSTTEKVKYLSAAIGRSANARFIRLFSGKTTNSD